MAAIRSRAGLYWGAAAVGAAVPLLPFLPWMRQYGLDPARFAGDLFANGVSGFFGLDVILAAVTLTIFVIVQGARDHVPFRWVAIAATFLLGVSCGLPLFLALRERALAR